jgi:hypothetical protein
LGCWGSDTREREKERNLLVLCVEGSSTSSSARILFSDYFFRRVKMVQQQATFAAGCFWSVELAFQRVPGVIKVKKIISLKNTKFLLCVPWRTFPLDLVVLSREWKIGSRTDRWQCACLPYGCADSSRLHRRQDGRSHIPPSLQWQDRPHRSCTTGI